jgi:hypothetical protein
MEKWKEKKVQAKKAKNVDVFFYFPLQSTVKANKLLIQSKLSKSKSFD